MASGTISVSCPGCNKSLSAKEAEGGRRGRCPHCGSIFDIPGVPPVIKMEPPPPPIQPAPPVKTPIKRTQPTRFTLILCAAAIAVTFVFVGGIIVISVFHVVTFHSPVLRPVAKAPYADFPDWYAHLRADKLKVFAAAHPTTESQTDITIFSLELDAAVGAKLGSYSTPLVEMDDSMYGKAHDPIVGRPDYTAGNVFSYTTVNFPISMVADRAIAAEHRTVGTQPQSQQYPIRIRAYDTNDAILTDDFCYPETDIPTGARGTVRVSLKIDAELAAITKFRIFWAGDEK